jgi:hypothetical protein
MAEVNTYNKFISSFESMFMCAENKTESWKKMNERIQQEDETVYTYFHEKVRLCRRLGLYPAEVKKMMCKGLRSKQMCAALLSNSHITEPEQLEDIRMFPEVDQNRSELFRPVTSHGRRVINYTSEKPAKMIAYERSPSTRAMQTHSTTRSTMKTNFGPRCYNCHLTGHISRDCTRPRQPFKCTRCNTEGHTTKYCKTVTSDVSLVSPSAAGQIMFYMKDVNINGNERPIIGLIDTGSAYTIIRRSVADQHELLIEPKAITMCVYGNAQTVTSHGQTVQS